MTAPRRIRMIAGPNGSGKSTLFEKLKKLVGLGVYVNADEIEKQITSKGVICLDDYSVQSSAKKLSAFIRKSGWGEFLKPNDLTINAGLLVRKCSLISSYHAACIADFFRSELMRSGESFTFETVMSHESKVQFLRKAQAKGYRTYLYFVSTEDPEINLQRITERVAKGGHPVPDDKVFSRYYKSLELLPLAIRHSNRAYIFDNSFSEAELKLEATDANLIKTYSTNMPVWISTYVIDRIS